jgi:hypothetical protein
LRRVLNHRRQELAQHLLAVPIQDNYCNLVHFCLNYIISHLKAEPS